MLLFFLELLARDDQSLTSRVHRLAMLEFIVLMVGALFRTVCHGVIPMHGTAWMRYESDRISVIGLLGLCFWKLALRVERFFPMEEYDVDLVPGLLASALANEIDSGVQEEPDSFSFNFEDSLMYDHRAFENLGRSATKHLAVPVRY